MRRITMSRSFPLRFQPSDDDTRPACQDSLGPPSIGASHGSAAGAILQEAGLDLAQAFLLEVVGFKNVEKPHSAF